MHATIGAPIPDPPVPALLRWMGARWRDSKRSYRMKWGELSFGDKGWALSLDLFASDPTHFSLHIKVWRIFSAYIHLPFLRRFVWEPDDMMESWGIGYHVEPSHLTLRWGRRYKSITMPWRDLVHISHDVLRPDGTYAPYVGEWEHDKEPDGRHVETHPYNYLLRSGEKQERIATVYVERRIWRLRALRWTRRFQKVHHYIEVSFSDEVGERTGSWKGGVVGCSYELRPNETPRECLKRMEQERRFK